MNFLFRNILFSESDFCTITSHFLILFRKCAITFTVNENAEWYFFLSALGPETEEQIKLVKDMIRFEFGDSDARSHLKVVKSSWYSLIAVTVTVLNHPLPIRGFSRIIYNTGPGTYTRLLMQFTINEVTDECPCNVNIDLRHTLPPSLVVLLRLTESD